MLGLHNIFLIAPPPTSCQFHQYNQQQSPPPPFSSVDHHIANQDSWTPLKLHSQDTIFPRKDGSNAAEDNKDNGNSSSRACRDCGNRAKKECEYSRCRTCCKSRGYACATHVKSTWVPTARRRERLAIDDGGGGTGTGTDGVSCGGVTGKRPRDNGTTATSNSFSTSNNNAATFFNFDTSSSYQDTSFKQSLPGQVQAPAVFRCIRVTAIGGISKAEIAYQAVVNIKGHVFKGFLYHQGIDQNNEFPCISKMHVAERNRDSTSPIVDLPNAYATSISQRLVGGNE